MRKTLMTIKILFGVWSSLQFHITLHFHKKTYFHFIVKPIILRYANQDNYYHVMQWDIVHGEHFHPTYPSLIFKWNKIQVQPLWMLECEKTLACRNMTSTFMNVTMWQRHFCMSHCDISFHVCHNVTLTLINVVMWH